MLFKENRKKGIGAMILVTGLTILLLCTVVYGFYLIVHNHKVSNASGETGSTEDWGESTEKIDSVADGASGEEDRIFLIKGNIHRANRYEKVDRLSYTSTVKYRQSDLELLDSDGLRLTRNEIYARHGRMFNDQTLQDYFNNQDWYSPQYAPDHFNDDLLNVVEKYNMELIHAFEINNGTNEAEIGN